MTKSPLKNDGTQYLFLISKIGSKVLLAIGLFFFIGLKLENTWPQNGILLLAFTLIGVAAAFYQTYKEVMKLGEEDQ